MTSAERELALQNLAESRERLLRMANGLTREQLHYRPATERWSVAECLEHIVMPSRSACSSGFKRRWRRLPILQGAAPSRAATMRWSPAPSLVNFVSRRLKF